MAVYKVPQDVEAEDKLLGPFSFRQFIYLLIAAGLGFITFGIIQLPVPFSFFAILPALVTAGLIILALPLRKDQPMEIYLLAIIRFYLKPKQRLWKPDGTTTGVVIDHAAVVQQQLTKDISQEEAVDKLSYLAQIVDTHGWAAKGVDMPQNSPINSVIRKETDTTDDIMDENNSLAKSFDDLISKQKQASRNAAMGQMHVPPRAAIQQPQASIATQPASAIPDAQPNDKTYANVHFNPYPTMHQQVVSPHSDVPQTSQQSTALDQTAVNTQTVQQPQKDPITEQVSPDIIRLANNNDLSIETIAHEAHRLKDGEEVVVSLR